jgi:uncharacterized protein (TIGR02099 family)
MGWRMGVRRLLDALIIGLVTWLLGTAAYVSTGRLLVPAVADYREELVARAETLFGRAIIVQDLTGEMQGAQPVFLLRGLRVHASRDEDSPILFELDNVTARLDLFASLWHRRPILDALQAEGLALEIIEETDGRWLLQGLGGNDQFKPDADAVLDALNDLRRITLLDSQIRVRPQGLPDWLFSEGDLTLLNQPGRHQLDARVTLPSGEELALRARMRRDPAWQESELEFYAALPALEWSQWLPSEWLERASVNQLVAGGQYWGLFERGRLAWLRGELDAPRLVLQGDSEPQVIEDLQAQLKLSFAESSQQLQLNRLQWRFGEHHWAPSRLQARVENGDVPRWELKADRLSLQWLTLLVPDHLDDPRAADILQQLDLQGTLRGVRVAGTAGEDALVDLAFSARLEEVSMAPWQAVPGFERISGSLVGTPETGSLRIDSRDWSMQLPRLFEHVWEHDRLLGELNWQWSEDDGLRLIAPGLRVEGPQGIGAVALNLHLPRPEETATMHLQVALRESAAGYHHLYLPTRAPGFSEALADWLASSELSGRIPLAIFNYQGSIEREVSDNDRSLELYAVLEQGHLKFQPRWPALEEVTGTLRLHGQDVLVEQGSALLWDTRLEDVQVMVGRNSTESLQLMVRGAHQGPLVDALRIGQETPVAELTGELFADWRGEGELVGELEMRLPLRAESTPELRMDWRVDARELWIPTLQAPLQDISGAMTYRHGEGLLGENLQLSFLGQPVKLDIRPDGQRQRLEASGRHPVSALSGWQLLGGLPFELASGSLDWQAILSLGAGRQELTLTSDLRRLALNLPGPLAKVTGERLPSRLTLDLRAEEQRWALAMGDDLRGAAHMRGDLLRAELRYRDGEPRRLPARGIAVGARFAEFDLPVWQAWLAEHFPDAQGMMGEGSAAPSVAQLQRLELHARRFNGLGRELHDLSVSGERGSEAWLVRIEQADVAGTLRMPHATGTPMAVNLLRLRFERPPRTDDGDALVEPIVPQDPLAAVKPSRLPAMDVRVEQILWGDDVVADLGFGLRPYSDGATLNDLRVNLRGGLGVEGQMDWREASGRSQFNGRLAAGNIGEVLRAWEYAPTLTSSSFQAVVDLTWPGSPAFFALKRGTGELQLKARDGVVQSGEGSAEALRIFGLLNFNALTRRLRLDFSDLFGKGTAYDSLETQLVVSDGILQTRTPLVMDGPSARIELDGTLDLPQDRIDMGMLVTLPLTNNLPLAAILVGAPYLGGALFIADRILGDRISRIASVKYRVSGDWQQPTVEFDRAFDNKAALEE